MYKVYCTTCDLTLETDATLPRALYVAERHTALSDHSVTITDNTGSLIDE